MKKVKAHEVLCSRCGKTEKALRHEIMGYAVTILENKFEFDVYDIADDLQITTEAAEEVVNELINILVEYKNKYAEAE